MFDKSGLDSKKRYDPSVWSTDPNFMRIRRNYDAQFFKTYAIGVEAYLAGNWKRAKKYLRELAGIPLEKDLALNDSSANEIWQLEDEDIAEVLVKGEKYFVYPSSDVDGPSLHLWNIMEKYQENGDSPRWWQSGRALKETRTVMNAPLSSLGSRPEKFASDEELGGGWK